MSSQQLKIEIVGAQGLRDADSVLFQGTLFGKCCVCEVHDKYRKKSGCFRTKTINFANPVWNHVHLWTEYEEGDMLVFTVFGSDAPKPGGALCRAELSELQIRSLRPFQVERFLLPLAGAGAAVGATLTVKVTVMECPYVVHRVCGSMPLHDLIYPQVGIHSFTQHHGGHIECVPQVNRRESYTLVPTIPPAAVYKPAPAPVFETAPVFERSPPSPWTAPEPAPAFDRGLPSPWTGSTQGGAQTNTVQLANTGCLTPPRYSLAPKPDWFSIALKRPFAVAELALQSASMNNTNSVASLINPNASGGCHSAAGSSVVMSGRLTPSFPAKAFQSVSQMVPAAAWPVRGPGGGSVSIPSMASGSVSIPSMASAVAPPSPAAAWPLRQWGATAGSGSVV